MLRSISSCQAHPSSAGLSCPSRRDNASMRRRSSHFAQARSLWSALRRGTDFRWVSTRDLRSNNRFETCPAKSRCSVGHRWDGVAPIPSDPLGGAEHSNKTRAKKQGRQRNDRAAWIEFHYSRNLDPLFDQFLDKHRNVHLVLRK